MRRLKGDRRDKLTVADIHYIMRLCLYGMSGYAIAKMFKLSKDTIYAIKHGRSWRHAERRNAEVRN